MPTLASPEADEPVVSASYPLYRLQVAKVEPPAKSGSCRSSMQSPFQGKKISLQHVSDFSENAGSRQAVHQHLRDTVVVSQLLPACPAFAC